ncbi:uncharacterized protein LOC132037794 isoform X1 [Lycium ferocissimum]|uniref:uncharacterized protein LOC132037794 isoform X1 n=1 Tax=Lycium ferocissimum TaxID=112874 RepID=UPI00281535A4|nr:uncharacterized protein LOC132037794 isoform X1 [Lycium ferocissimum]
MGALAPVSRWIPEDDLNLKNAIEAGASLESLAKGAVQFSQRFSVQELQDRWHALLYDTVISAEASTLMIELDRSASTPKCNRFESAKESKNSVLLKRKTESIRSCYYAMRKRIRNDPFDSMDMNFLGGAGNNDEPQSMDCVFVDSIRDTFGDQQSNFDVTQNGISVHERHDSICASDCVTSSPGFSIGLRNHNGDVPLSSFNVTEDFPDALEESVALAENQSTVGELGELNELPVCGLFEAEDLEPNLPMRDQCDDNVINSSGFESQVLNSSVPDCDLSFHDLDYSPTPPEMPDWSTIGHISVPALPDFEEEHNIHNTFVVPIDDHSSKMAASECGVVNSNSNLRHHMSCNELKNSVPSTDDYLAELSESLFNFTDEEELLFIDPDGIETIDKSYFDGLSSLLLDCPDGVGDMSDIGVSEASNAPDERLTILDDACPGESGDKSVYHYNDKPQVSSSDFQMLSSALTVNPAFPEMRGGVICCTLNTEDPEVPSNDDVFLPVLMPSTSFPSMTHWKYDETYHPLSSSAKDLSYNQKASRKKEQNSHSEYSNSYQMNEPPSQVEKFNRDHKVQHEVPNDNSQHVVRRNLPTSDCPRPVISGNLSAVNVCQGDFKENIAKDEQDKNLSRIYTEASMCLEKNAICTKEHDTTSILQKNEPILAETALIKTTIPEASANNTSSDSEEFLYESDEDIPYFSDVEAVILDMDLSPNGQDMCSSKRVKEYQREDFIRTIIRLEQADHACKQRKIAARGAFAVLIGCCSKHFIRKPEVLLGRASEDVKVDIDLGREGRNNKISRRQAIIKMDMHGLFHLRNVGKYPIHVNGKEVLRKQSLTLTSGSFIEVRELTFTFEINQSQVKTYVEILKDSQSQGIKA